MSYFSTTSKIDARPEARAAGSPGSIQVCLPYVRTHDGWALVTCKAATLGALGISARNGLNHACSWRPRAWACSIANASGSYAGDGATPDLPVRKVDQGARVVG